MDKLTIYKNKGEVFKCQFKIEGASISDTSVRLCLEFENNKNLFFNGTIKENGDCEIQIPHLREFDDKFGKLTVEAIADSIYFKLYEAEVELKNAVEVKMETASAHTVAKKPEIKLEGISQSTPSKKLVTKTVAEIVEERETPKDEPKKVKSLKDYIKGK